MAQCALVRRLAHNCKRVAASAQSLYTDKANVGTAAGRCDGQSPQRHQLFNTCTAPEHPQPTECVKKRQVWRRLCHPANRLSVTTTAVKAGQFNGMGSSKRKRQYPALRLEWSCLTGGIGSWASSRSLHTNADNSEGSKRGPEVWPQLETEEDIKSLTAEIVEQATKRDVMVRSVPVLQMEKLVLDLHRCGLPPVHIVSLLVHRPAFIQNHRHLLETVDLLLTYGLDLQQVKTVLQDFPAILQVSSTHMTQTMDVLQQANFQQKSISAVIAGNPSILLVAQSGIRNRLTMLQELFKTKDTVTIVVDTPEVLTDDWESIQAKFDYVFHNMKITQKQMVHASMFKHSLSRIKKRHVFLVRTGLFDMSKRKEGEKSPNPRLDHIINTSDQTFCKKFGGFHVKEFRAFCQLFDKEDSQLEDLESDSDSETENVHS